MQKALLIKGCTMLAVVLLFFINRPLLTLLMDDFFGTLLLISGIYMCYLGFSISGKKTKNGRLLLFGVLEIIIYLYIYLNSMVGFAGTNIIFGWLLFQCFLHVDYTLLLKKNSMRVWKFFTLLACISIMLTTYYQYFELAPFYTNIIIVLIYMGLYNVLCFFVINKLKRYNFVINGQNATTRLQRMGNG
jgi:uncharacterized membrane protein HdeD (DUF308 family)